LIAYLAANAAAHGSSSIEGIWRSPGGNSIMKIAPCGKGPCGTIVWASDKAKHDSKKTTPHLIGAHLVTHLEHHNGTWKGKLFIPDQNMHVSAKISRANNHELKVAGCYGFICKSQHWAAFHHPLPTDGSKPAPK